MPKAAKRQGIRKNAFLLTIGQVIFCQVTALCLDSHQNKECQSEALTAKVSLWHSFDIVRFFLIREEIFLDDIPGVCYVLPFKKSE